VRVFIEMSARTLVTEIVNLKIKLALSFSDVLISIECTYVCS
jgi:hypothetical protein